MTDTHAAVERAQKVLAEAQPILDRIAPYEPAEGPVVLARDVLALAAALEQAERREQQAKSELRASESLAVRESESRLRLTQRAVAAEARAERLAEALRGVKSECDGEIAEAWKTDAIGLSNMVRRALAADAQQEETAT